MHVDRTSRSDDEYRSSIYELCEAQKDFSQVVAQALAKVWRDSSNNASQEIQSRQEPSQTRASI
jgi:hypothetical protein